MVVLRCTKRLRDRLACSEVTDPPPSTTVLGDWYCNLVRFGRLQVILCVSEKTLLPVFLLARDAHGFPQRLAEALSSLLVHIGIPEPAIRAEIEDMGEYTIARTASRTVLGSMNDFEKMADVETMMGESALAQINLDLMTAPCKPIGYRSPVEAVRQRFRA